MQLYGGWAMDLFGFLTERDFQVKDHSVLFDVTAASVTFLQQEL
jgi:hypothetical protein